MKEPFFQKIRRRFHGSFLFPHNYQITEAKEIWCTCGFRLKEPTPPQRSVLWLNAHTYEEKLEFEEEQKRYFREKKRWFNLILKLK